MSYHDSTTADCEHKTCSGIKTVIRPKAKDIGGFEVRRALPSVEARTVGPFIFFDQMGPATFAPGTGIDVRPHPHIGLSTLTWLIEGEIMHRDSLGYTQPIRPGEVNWMTAGSGIVHSERTPDDVRAVGHSLLGLQVWMALPSDFQEADPSFQHYVADDIPTVELDGAKVMIVAGDAWGASSPVSVYSRTLYADVRLDTGATLNVPPEHEERAIYVVSGSVQLGDEVFGEATMVVLQEGETVPVQAPNGAHLALIGGDKLKRARKLWWNFAHTDVAMIEAAKERWTSGGFDMVEGDGEFIPLPAR